MTRLAINGIGGRMGRQILAMAVGDPRFQIVAGLEDAASPLIGTDLGELAMVGKLGVTVSSAPAGELDAVIDFSSPAGTMAILDYCLARKIPLVIGTTGLTNPQLDKVAAAGKTIPVLRSANMSVGVNVLLRVAAEVARTLGSEYDCEIVETHHRFKADAPSGTALALLDSILSATGRTRDGHVIYGRKGDSGKRPAGQVAVHAVRLGDTVGEHTVSFGCLGETLELRHSAHTREIFAAGALRAAAWITAQKPGLYSMQDMLFGGK